MERSEAKMELASKKKPLWELLPPKVKPELQTCYNDIAHMHGYAAHHVPMEDIMSLQYSLTESALTASPHDYQARMEGVKVHNFESVVARMVQKGTTVTKTDTLAVLNTFFEVLAEITKAGECVNIGAFKTQLSIQGVFDGVGDSFDPKRHHINLSMHAGVVLKKVLDSISVEKVAAADPMPHLLEVKDAVSGTLNNVITAGGVVEIVGSLLKITGEHAENGVYFVDAHKTPYKVVTLVANKPACLIVMVPTLPKGTYTLEVRTQFNGSGTALAHTRKGVFPHTLTVL